MGEIEQVWFKGSDGNDLQGWILKPPDFDPSKKYPSILEIHGGPLMQYGNIFMHEFHYFASLGYVVYYCNPVVDRVTAKITPGQYMTASGVLKIMRI